MKKTGRCPKCSSSRVARNVRVLDKASKSGPALDLEVAVEKSPRARIFKGEERFEVRAWICADCGLTEFYTSNPGRVYDLAGGRSDE